MSRTETITVEDIDFEVTFSYHKGEKAQLEGPWENCHPEELAEAELESVKIADWELIDILSESMLNKISEKIIDMAEK